MKVYEYLAAGLPVVASVLPALEGMAELTVAEGVEATETEAGVIGEVRSPI